MRTEEEITAMLEDLVDVIAKTKTGSDLYIHLRAEIHILRWVLRQF